MGCEGPGLVCETANRAGSTIKEVSSGAMKGRLGERLRLLGTVPVAFLTPAWTVRVDFTVDFWAGVGRDRSFVCVSRCCFMLSARVNFFWHAGQEQETPFSAVWILE